VGNINSDTTGFDLSPKAITYTATDIAILASFVNFLFPPRGFGESWGGVKKITTPARIPIVSGTNSPNREANASL